MRLPTTTISLLCFVVAQPAFAYLIRDVKPYWEVLPPVPSERSLDAQAFGDRQFLYRNLVLDLQNFGDTGGRRTRMSDYDMPSVVAWLKALDYLDKDADHHLKLATQYFAQTQDVSQLDLLVHYVAEQVASTPERHWRWLLEAIYLAQKELHDTPLAVRLADQLGEYDYPDMILIARQLDSFLHREIGDFSGAADRMERVLSSQAGKVTAEEADYMRDYIQSMRAQAAKVEASQKRSD